MKPLLIGLCLLFSSVAASGSEDRISVVLFVSTDCPVANSYAPTINRLASEFAAHSIQFTLVYPDTTTLEEEIQKHREEYQLIPPGLLDIEHKWVKKAGATITPEVAVFDQEDVLIYRGRIDNLYSDFGDRRREVTEHDLREVLKRLARGDEVSFRETSAVGCLIEPLTP